MVERKRERMMMKDGGKERKGSYRGGKKKMIVFVLFSFAIVLIV